MTNLLAEYLRYLRVGRASGFFPFVLHSTASNVKTQGDNAGTKYLKYEVQRSLSLTAFSLVFMGAAVCSTLYQVVVSAQFSIASAQHRPLNNVSTGFEDWVYAINMTIGSGAVIPMCIAALFMWTPLACIITSMQEITWEPRTLSKKDFLPLGGDVVAVTLIMAASLVCNGVLLAQMASNDHVNGWGVLAWIMMATLGSWVFWAGDFLFLSLNQVTRHALSKLVNKNLRSRPEYHEAALEHLDSVMKQQSQICGLAKNIADCFACWILWSCLLVFVMVLLGIYLLIVLSSKSPDMFSMALMYVPSAAMPTARLFLLSRSASLVQSEVS